MRSQKERLIRGPTQLLYEGLDGGRTGETGGCPTEGEVDRDKDTRTRSEYVATNAYTVGLLVRSGSPLTAVRRYVQTMRRPHMHRCRLPPAQ